MSDSWKDDLPEGLRSNQTIEQTTDITSMAQQLVDSQAYMGSAIRIPSEDAGEQDWTEFNRKLTSKVPTLMQRPNPESEESMEQIYGILGKPESASDYKVTEREVPEGVELQTESVEMFRGLAHKAGLNQSQFQQISDSLTDDSIRSVEEGIREHNNGHQDLRKEWGLASKDRMAAADKIRKDFFPDLNDVEGLHPNMVRGLYKLSDQLGVEATGLSSDLGIQNAPGLLPPQQAQDKLHEIGRNKNHPYWNAGDPEHASWVGERGRYIDLIKQAIPGKK